MVQNLARRSLRFVACRSVKESHARFQPSQSRSPACRIPLHLPGVLPRRRLGQPGRRRSAFWPSRGSARSAGVLCARRAPHATKAKPKRRDPSPSEIGRLLVPFVKLERSRQASGPQLPGVAPQFSLGPKAIRPQPLEPGGEDQVEGTEAVVPVAENGDLKGVVSGRGPAKVCLEGGERHRHTYLVV